jgi:hypothetical protein
MVSRTSDDAPTRIGSMVRTMNQSRMSRMASAASGTEQRNVCIGTGKLLVVGVETLVG